jgi:hypothetical protein
MGVITVHGIPPVADWILMEVHQIQFMKCEQSPLDESKWSLWMVVNEIESEKCGQILPKALIYIISTQVMRFIQKASK